MAYAWTAVYGYYVEDTTQPGVVDLTNKYTTDSGFHISTPSTLFTLPESLELPSPINSHSYIRKETAFPRVITLTEYNYTTLLPVISSDSSSVVITYANVLKWISSVEKMFPWAFIYDRALIEASFYTRNYTRCLFVWLTDINIIIDHNGAIFSVDPETNKITKIASGGFYFRFAAQYTQQNIQPAYINNDGFVYVSFRYAGSWYQNYIFSRYKEDLRDGTEYEEYNVWYDSNRASSIQNVINNAIIGTESNPKYKYKTDPADPDTDPYTPPFTPLTPSGPGGGDGTHDPEHDGDPAPIPDITQFTDISDTGLMSVWNPTLAQLDNLAQILWNDNFAAAAYNFFYKPMDLLIGLSIVPLSVPGTADVLKFGKLTQYGVAMNKVNRQYVEVDCGGFNCDKIWGSYLDYQIRFQIYLPFIGYKPLQAEDVIGHNLRVKYHVDVVTGCCIAYILTDDFCTYTFAGNCSYQIPITDQGFENIVGSMIQTVGTIGAAVIAPEAAAAPAALAAAGSSLNTISAKATYQKSGGMGGNSAFMGMRTPVLLSYVPRACIPNRQNKIMGYPSYQTKQLSDVTGYTEVYKIHLDGISATDTEKNEILAALSEGVIL